MNLERGEEKEQGFGTWREENLRCSLKDAEKAGKGRKRRQRTLNEGIRNYEVKN